MKTHLIQLALIAGLLGFSLSPAGAYSTSLKLARGANNNLTLSANTTAAALVLQSSVDLVNWLDGDIALATNGSASFNVDPSYAAIFFRTREAATAEGPSPLTISAALDSDFFLTNAITAAGGSISVTDDNGTVYTLAVPAGALDGVSRISMQVAENANSFPLAGGFLGGVVLQPAGTWFFTPATLTITSAGPLPGPNPVGFEWNPSTGEFFLTPTVISNSTSVVFTLEQLGAFGAGAATDQDLTNIVAHAPSNIANQYAQDLALIDLGMTVTINSATPSHSIPMVRTFQADLSSQPQAAESQVLQLIYTNAVVPALAQASQNDSFLDSAMSVLLRWLDQANGAGAGLGPQIKDAFSRAHEAIVYAINDNYQRCEEHDLGRIAELISAARWMQAPWLNGAFTAQEIQNYTAEVQECAQFELDISSAVQFTSSVIGQCYLMVNATIPVQFQLNAQGALSSLAGNGSLDVTNMQVYAGSVTNSCSYAGASSSSGQAFVYAVDLGLNNTHSTFSPTNMTVLLDPFLQPPSENFAITCVPGETIPGLSGFWTVFMGKSLSSTLGPAPSGPPQAHVMYLTGWMSGTNLAQVASLEAGGNVNASIANGAIDTMFSFGHKPPVPNTNCIVYPEGPGPLTSTRNTPLAYVNLSGEYQTTKDVPGLDVGGCVSEMVVLVTSTNCTVPANFVQAAFQGLNYKASVVGFYWCPPTMPGTFLPISASVAGAELAQFLFDLKKACPCVNLRVIGVGDGALYSLGAVRSLAQSTNWVSAGYKLDSLDLVSATADADAVGTQNSWDRDQYGPELEAVVNNVNNDYNSADSALAGLSLSSSMACSSAGTLGASGTSASALPGNYHEQNNNNLPLTLSDFEFNQASLAPIVKTWQVEDAITTNAFAWSMEPRFGLRNPSDPRILLYRYDPDYVLPANGYTVHFDASGMLGGGNQSDGSVLWTIQGTNGVSMTVQTNGCSPRLTLNLPMAVYTVTAAVQPAGGQMITNTQEVAVRDFLIVSFGDSYASGEGNPDIQQQIVGLGNVVPVPFMGASPVWQNGQCHRSAYSSRAQFALRLERSDPHSSVTFVDLSCSGSTTTNVLYGWNPGPQNNNLGPTPIPSQVDTLSQLVGGKSGRTVDALIISIGGNDVGFAGVVGDCVTDGLLTAPVMAQTITAFAKFVGLYNSPPNDPGLLANFETALRTLGVSYSLLNEALAGSMNISQVYITEYPNLITDANGSTCNYSPGASLTYADGLQLGDLLGLINSTDASWASRTVEGSAESGTGLNGLISQAAIIYGWTFVGGIEAAFVDHGWCAGNPNEFVHDSSWCGYANRQRWIRTYEDSRWTQGPVYFPPFEQVLSDLFGGGGGFQNVIFPSKGVAHPNAQGHTAIANILYNTIATNLLSR